MAVDNNEYIPIQLSEVTIGNASDNFFHLVFFKENDQKQTFSITSKDAERVLSLLNKRFNSFAIYAIDNDFKIKVAPKISQNKNIADFINDINHIYENKAFDANDAITKLQNHFNPSQNIQTQPSQATYAVVPGALASTTNNNANNATLNNNNQNIVPTSYIISDIRPAEGMVHGFYLKFADPLSQQKLTEAHTKTIAQDILNLEKMKSEKYNVQLGLVFDEIKFTTTKFDDPTKNMTYLLKTLRAICDSYNITDDFLLEGAKKIVAYHLNLLEPKAERFALEVFKYNRVITDELIVSNTKTNAPKKGFFDQISEQVSTKVNSFISSIQK